MWAAAFSFSVKTHNLLRFLQIKNLEDLLLISRKGLTEGLEKDEWHYNTTYYRNKEVLNPLKPQKAKFGPASMKEIDSMLSSLGLKLCEERAN